jgi:hypothetical protein
MTNAGVRAFLLGVALLATAGCVAQPEFQCPNGLQEVVRYELFFGLDHADGRSVSPEEWEAFVSDTITPRFQLGLSVLDVRGQWQRPDGVIERENTKMVMLAHPPPADAGMVLVNEISREYQRRFDQDPVFRSVSHNECSGLFVE